MKLRATLLATAALAVMVTPALAQHSTMKSRQSMAVASSANMERMLPKVGLNRTDKSFVRQAAMINMAEVQLGQLAQRNGGRWSRGYGKDMEREHNLALAELRKIARQKGVALPRDVDAKHRSLYARLSRLRGAAFDNAYRQAMVKGHGEVLTKVQGEIRMGRDSMVRNYAVMMEPSVKMHLKMAQHKMTMMMNEG